MSRYNRSRYKYNSLISAVQILALTKIRLFALLVLSSKPVDYKPKISDTSPLTYKLGLSQ